MAQTKVLRQFDGVAHFCRLCCSIAQLCPFLIERFFLKRESLATVGEGFSVNQPVYESIGEAVDAILQVDLPDLMACTRS